MSKVPNLSCPPNDLAAETEKLVRTHLPLVGHIVRETLGRVPSHISRDELVSAGMFALATAAKAFDSAHGVTFSAYAAIRIRGAIADELRGRDWASRSVRTRAREVERVRQQLAVTLSRTPSRADIAHAMGVAVTELDAIDNDVHRAGVLSLQALTPENDEMPVASGEDPPESVLLRREQYGYLADAVAELPERLATVIRGYFFEQRKMLDIAAELGVTESRVSQLRAEALSLLRTGMRAGEASDEPAATPLPVPTDLAGRARSRAAACAAYYSAVASRSTVAGRLAATTLLGEPRSAFTAERSAAVSE